MEDEEDASLTGGPTLRSARIDFPAVMTLAACRLTAPPTAATEACKPPEIHGPVCLAQPTFISPQLPEVWRCVEATWQQQLKTKAPIAAMAGIVKVVETTRRPGVPPPR